MKLIHSKLSNLKEPVKAKIKPMTEQQQFNREMNYKFFEKACKEYAAEIAEIQEVFPGWEPQFRG